MRSARSCSCSAAAPAAASAPVQTAGAAARRAAEAGAGRTGRGRGRDRAARAGGCRGARTRPIGCSARAGRRSAGDRGGRSADHRRRRAAPTRLGLRRRAPRAARGASSSRSRRSLAGLAMMAQRPPLLALADRGSTDELVKVRRAARFDLAGDPRPHRALSSQLAQGRAARGERRSLRAPSSSRSRDRTWSRGASNSRRSSSAGARRSLRRPAAAGAERGRRRACRRRETSSSCRATEAEQPRRRAPSLASWRRPTPAPPRPFAPEGPARVPPFAYQLAGRGAGHSRASARSTTAACARAA